MERSGFFNSENGDRRYKASDYAEFFNSFITNGVFPNLSTSLQVISNNDMTVTVKAGKAWINGYIYYNDADLILPVDVADGVLNRIDRIVLRMDTTGRAITAQVKKGAFSSSAVAPVLERDADGYELGIADIAINAGATAISQSSITDLRLSSDYCGVVSFVNPIDVTAIFNQYQDWFNSKTNQYQSDMSSKETQFQSDFNIWFNSIKGQLGTDAAGNLQNQINALLKIYGGTSEPANKQAGDIWFKELT
jgi:hypothetical protein